MATPAQWLAGARPKTLPAALAPVLVGTGAAAALGRLPPRCPRSWRSSSRSPCRWPSTTPTTTPTAGAAPTPTGSARCGSSAPAPRRPARCWSRRGWPSRVAAVAGLALAALSSWWLVAVGAVCIAAAWTYTGGPLPYGYRALGEVFVFVFFGLVAVVGHDLRADRDAARAWRSPSPCRSAC